MRLILLRHGETMWNAEGRIQGHDNSPLSARGIEQARRFVGYARALQPYRVVSSDLGRTRQTAEIIGHGDCPADPRLREFDIGVWTGRARAELLAEEADNYHAWRAGTYAPEGAEIWSVFRDRIAGGLRHWLSNEPGDLLAIVHGGVIRAACDAFLGLPPSRVIPVTPGTATIFSFSDGDTGSARLEGYNIGAVVPDVVVAD